ncbi:MAG: hypothetical protein EAZ90_02450 [Oscillatoriales cyanobacterium]|nr:MAG: hypothetical protein EAZ94_11460 [Oscillatoriales cyanobacterium]TAE24901.1 MAG: hypothetical protein EAZ93_12145 [Oscillatoriales cyanobacterium]TAE45431.1 MAG: hypothetical protein EAZ90_02450 [Oscillatoriales cyanobacterium]TAE56762.1 MAG: hypothetical protein EAZ88_03470 [Oscillatoriales cyanobacterium]TAE71840.1 MAG: hypothetical protein EAZ86_01740 [Oscillatoriales cyanobacterium]
MRNEQELSGLGIAAYSGTILENWSHLKFYLKFRLKLVNLKTDFLRSARWAAGCKNPTFF